MSEERLIAEYLRLRDVVLAEENRQHKKREAIIKDKMHKIEAAFLSKYARESRAGNNITSITTHAGRATRVKRTKLKLFDPAKFRDFILDDPDQRIDMLQNRLHQTAYELFVAENPETSVEGINSSVEFGVTISKPTKRD